MDVLEEMQVILGQQMALQRQLMAVGVMAAVEVHVLADVKVVVVVQADAVLVVLALVIVVIIALDSVRQLVQILV